MSEDEKVTFTSRLPGALLKRLKVFAAANDTTIEEFVERSIRRELDRREQEVAS